MNDTQSTRACPQCEQPLPPDAPEGLCPECLMLGALETMPFPDDLKPSGRLPEPGETFGGYRIGRELGRGGMGAVFEAVQLETGRRVALKLLNHQLDSPEARARFLREGRLAASINHPNSVYVFGTEEIGEMPAISMELVGGGTLEELVKTRGALPVGEAVDAILQVIAGLEAAQQIGVLHRDVKPGNCFQDADGTVKIGDFGLSISTEARDEKHLTMEGTIFGTPAFSSPEQLRGDELNVRSDIYAVGATLFYLLTGRPAFRGKSVAQLFANVLEGPTPNPREIRPDLPAPLAAVVVRSLQKAPGERFGSYAELRKALAPFSSDAPVPGSIPLRLAAGFIDWMVYSAVVMTVQFALFGSLVVLDENRTRTLLMMAAGLSLWLLYFGWTEGRWGCSLGKAICRLRVADKSGNPPGFLRAGLRAAIWLAVPSLPVWIFSGLDPTAFAAAGFNPTKVAVLASFYVILGLLFVSVRKRNGWATVVDLVTRTRVIRRKSLHERSPLAHDPDAPVTMDAEMPQVGPYHVLASEGNRGDSEWLVGYDTRLLRKVWIRLVPAGTAPVSPEMRQIGRIGRLRWIGGRRSEEENWDAYEFPGGQSLASLAARERPAWSQVRYWLLDLAEELDASGKDGTLPELLSLDRIWITAGGRVKLLDFGVSPGSVPEAASPVSTPAELVKSVGELAAPPLPLHALEFIGQMTEDMAPRSLAMALKPLTRRVATVTRARRAALVAGCLAFPLAGSLLLFAGTRMLEQWRQQYPGIMEMNQLLTIRNVGRSPWMRNERTPDDRLFAIYLSVHHRDTISDPAIWHSIQAQMMMAGDMRAFAERSIVEYPHPTEAEIREAEEALRPLVEVKSGTGFDMPKWFPLISLVSGVLVYVCLPAILASVICRGGLVMLVCGVAVANRDGARASRGRCLWRSLVTWSPWLLAPIWLMVSVPFVGIGWAAGLAAAGVIGMGIVSLRLPGRGLQDRIAGTCLVPR